MQRSEIRVHGVKDTPGLWQPPTQAPDFTLFHPGYSLDPGLRRGDEFEQKSDQIY